jgi:hypothetical protein
MRASDDQRPVAPGLGKATNIPGTIRLPGMSVQLAAPDFRWAADKVQFTPETSMTRRPLPAALAAPGVTQVTLAGAIGTRTDDKRVFPPHRIPLRALRRPSRARIQRRAAADRQRYCDDGVALKFEPQGA